MCNRLAKKWLFAYFYVRYQYKTQKIFEEATKGNPYALEYFPDEHKTEEMFEKLFKKNLRYWNLLLIRVRPKICEKVLLKEINM